MIKGKIDCKACNEIPSGSVIFIYVFNADNKEVVGHQTLQNISKFPFEYRVQIDKENISNCALRVMIEKGESTLYYKDDFKLAVDGHEDVECDLEVDSYTVNPVKFS